MKTLQAVLSSIDWTENIRISLSSGTVLQDIDSVAHQIAVWSMQLEQADVNNPALCFVREMQHSIQHSGALIALCFYKPSAAASRTLVESCMYYSFFRTHPQELATLVNDKKYYVGKTDIIAYHKQHTYQFRKRQDALGLIGRLEAWYSDTSAIVHGQLPGVWNTHTELSQTSYSKDIQNLATKALVEGVALVNDLLFCTVTQSLWSSFAPEAKSFLIKGMPTTRRQALELDMR